MTRSFALVPRLVCLAAPLVLAGSLAAQTTTTPATPTTPAITTPAVTNPATTKATPPKQPVLELPRFKSSGKPGEVPRLAKAKVTVDELLPQLPAGAKTVTKQNFNYLTLDAGKEWSRPLRGGARDTTFVSFLAYGSVGTVFGRQERGHV